MPAISATMPAALVHQICAVMGDVARDLVSGAHVAVALPHYGEPWAAVCADPTAAALNDIEESSGGPALDALWSGRIARIASTLSQAKWPEYVEACKHHGVGSVIALPISIDSVRVGVMTVASNDYYAFGPEETRIGVQAATRAAAVLVPEGGWRPSSSRSS
jgi:hypothetical protein